MKLEIQHKGCLILALELPFVQSIEELKFLEGDLNKKAYLHNPTKKTKKYVKDVPRVSVTKKEVVNFKRPKAVYSNTQF